MAVLTQMVKECFNHADYSGLPLEGHITHPPSDRAGEGG